MKKFNPSPFGKQYLATLCVLAADSPNDTEKFREAAVKYADYMI